MKKNKKQLKFDKQILFVWGNSITEEMSIVVFLN